MNPTTLHWTTADNSHLLCKGKFHCIAEFFCRVRTKQAKSVVNSTSAKQLNPNKQSRSAVMVILPLMTQVRSII